MADTSYLDWPFFEDRHRDLAARLDAWAGANLDGIDHHDVDGACRDLVARLNDGGWLKHAAIDPDIDGAKLDVR